MNFLIAAAIAGLFPASAEAALPAGFEVETVASGLELPGSMAFAPDGRIFIGEKSGVVRVIKNGTLLPAPVIALTDVNAYGDRGLLSIVLDPNFSSNGYLYLLYTYENTPGANFAGEKTGRLARVTVVGDTADESTKAVILGSVGGTLAAPSCENYPVTSDCIPSDSPSHSTGAMRFGTDGKLYVTLGDGAHFDYVDARAMRAQNLDSLAGKLLRINPDGTAPSDNPFYTGNPNDNRSKVYAYGLRNAFRINFRPSNNSLYAGDVGWGTWEEVDKIVRGGNYGWPCREGNFATSYNCTVANRIDPVYAYAHDVNGAGAVVAGDFATSYPASYANSFFIGDYAQNWIKIVNVDANDNYLGVADFMTAEDGAMGPVALDRGPDGNIYYIAIYTGELRRIVYTTGNRQPIAQIGTSATNGTAPLTVNFSSAGSSDPDGDPLSYSWSFGDGATSTASSTQHTYTANGSYTAVLTVTDGKGGLNTKSATITVGNRAPTAVVSSPENGSLYKANDTITVSGFGTDPEDGTITGASSLTWTIVLHHNTHIHILETLSGPNATFQAPDHSGATDIYTEVRLTVTDSGGLTNTKSINLYLDNNSATGGNLIKNPSFEDAVPGAPDSPQYWLRGGWGVIGTVYGYPVSGYQGLTGAKLTVVNYSSGDAKWFHDPVTVAPNTTYTFTGYYTSNVPVTVIAQFGYGNGTYTYPTLGAELPAAGTWTRVDRTFTTPANAQTAVVAILINRVGELTVDNFSLVAGTSTPPSDTVAPSVSISAPAANATVSGTTTVSATATDNVGVSDVRFFVDNALANTDASAPYSFVWDSRTAGNGSHSVFAVARDAAGNVATSTPVSFSVNNGTTTPPVSANLIANGSFENGTTGNPTGWRRGAWGTNTVSYNYPVAGRDGNKAAEVNVTAYTDGDIKWFPDEIPMEKGRVYTFSSWYKSNTISDVIGRYTLSDGSYHYFGVIKEIQPSATWKSFSASFIPPDNAVSFTPLHLISSVGYLTTDDVSLVITGTGTSTNDTAHPIVEILTPSNNATVSGTVNVTASSTDNVGVTYVMYAIDGTPVTGNEITTAPYAYSWNSASVGNGTHTIKATTHDAVGNNSTHTITVTVNNTGTPADTVAPSVSISAPAANATVSGTTTVSATAADNVGVASVQFLIDDVLVNTDTTAPYSFDWNTVAATNGNHSVRATARDAAGNTATTFINIAVQNSSSTTPLVTLTSPATGDVLSGTVTVSASVTDRSGTGIKDVHFMLENGLNAGGRSTSAPYTGQWNTTLRADGTYNLVAVVMDNANNRSTSTPVTVTVRNATTTNLIANGSLESGATTPTDWFQGNWGTNAVAWSYPVSGLNGGKAAKVAMTSYADGDAKWFFKPVTVTGGATYSYSSNYMSNVATTLTARYTLAGGAFIYADLGTVPASATWQRFERTIAMPASATEFTVFHRVNAIGELTVDDYSLIAE